MTRSALALLSALTLAGCGLANGISDGYLRSPLAGVFGGEGEGEGEGELPEVDDACSDPDFCLPAELVCDFDAGESGTCQEPDVWAWCDEALDLGSREDGGPILFDPVLGDENVVCVDVDVDYYDPDGDFPDDETDLLERINVRTDGNGGIDDADTVDSIVDLSGDGMRGFFVVRVCSTTLPGIVAVSVQDYGDNRSNPACG